MRPPTATKQRSVVLALLLFITSSAVILSGCGGSEDAETQPESSSPTSSSSGTSQGSVDKETAAKIALAAVGGGSVTYSQAEDDKGAAWEIEVTRADGVEVDVLVASDGSVVGKVNKGQSDDAATQSGGNAGTATSGNAINRRQASRAALDHIGSGRVTYIYPEDDIGAAWEVEVTKPDGSEVDVLVAPDGSIIRQVAGALARG